MKKSTYTILCLAILFCISACKNQHADFVAVTPDHLVDNCIQAVTMTTFIPDGIVYPQTIVGVAIIDSDNTLNQVLENVFITDRSIQFDVCASRLSEDIEYGIWVMDYDKTAKFSKMYFTENFKVK